MNIANKLTLSRIIMIPIFMILMIFPFGSIKVGADTIYFSQFVAGLVFIIASVTDYLDGYLARKLNLVTSFGAFFDPMADKLLVIAAFLLLIEMTNIPAWAVFIIIARELMVTGLRVLLAQNNGKVMSAALPGKIKTFTQMFSIIFYLFNDFGSGIPISTFLFYICLIFTIYSGIDYFWNAKFLFKDL